MKSKSFILLFAALALLSACNKKATSCFTHTVNGTTASFNADCSENAVFYEWSFGDGSETDGIYPVHQYGKSGNFYVTLRVTNEDGKVHLSNQTVTTKELCAICVTIDNDTQDTLGIWGPVCGTTEEVDQFCTSDCQYSSSFATSYCVYQ